MPDVIGIGAAVYDTLLLTPSFPEEDTKLRATRILFQGGGPCTTALVACAKLGLRAAFIGAVGDDHAGDYIAGELARYGVDTTCLLRRAGCVSFHSFVILNQSAATRTCVAYPGTAEPPQPCEIPEDTIRASRVLHLDGNNLHAAIHAARIARASGVKVCLDAGSPYPGIESLLPLVDWLIPSEEFVRRITGQSDSEIGARALYAMYKPQTLVVTQGSRGGFVLTPDGIRNYPVFPVDVVDTNGAGDVFHGAYITGRLQGMDTYAAAIFASAASALKCMGFGARENTPSFQKVSEFLRTRGY
ncbi:MAG: PfkB family carbohydrate kinase [Clostridiaceae bacterium]|nr:PfkB family carbohydrate kinase [Clostridiaceae bacterium]